MSENALRSMTRPRKLRREIGVKRLMPRYFFDTHDGNRPVVDSDGCILESDQGASEAAVARLLELAKAALSHDGSQRTLIVAVRTQEGTSLLHATLAFSLQHLVTTDPTPSSPIVAG